MISVKLLLVQLNLNVGVRDVDGPSQEARANDMACQLLTDAQDQESRWRKDLTAAHDLNHKLNQLLPLIAADEYVYSTLEYELQKGSDAERVVLISELFDESELAELVEEAKKTEIEWHSEERPRSDASRRRAQQALTKLYEARDEEWRYERAVTLLKRYYLLLYAILVSVTLLGLSNAIVSAGSAGDFVEQLPIVALAGALGSELAAMLKLRDAVVRLNDLPAVIAVVVSQALIGAALGLVSWLLLGSDIIQLGDEEAALQTYSLVAFASGFSEPFSLRLIDRFTTSS